MPDSTRLLSGALALSPLEAGGAAIKYSELDALSDRVRDRLRALGVKRGDRVGLYLRKSIEGVAGLLGAMKAGAAYVPVDPEAPARRGAFILGDCSVAVVLTENRLRPALEDELDRPGVAPAILSLDLDRPTPLSTLLDELDRTSPAPPTESVPTDPSDLAYILYTSGSTGNPKGVRLSHRAALAFVDWCAQEMAPTVDDVFSSHAPFHFDLSIHDLFVPLTNGAALVLIGEELGKEPLRLAEAIADHRITVWYSTPSILNLLTRFGGLEERDWSRLRLVLFAGEVYPIPQLRALREHWPGPAMYNLYGPTETNVCTYFPLPELIPDDRTTPFPIGWPCAPHLCRVVDSDGKPLPKGSLGELVVHGPGVMDGYWNLPERTAVAFLDDHDGRAWYRTGDIVLESPDGSYDFHGRRDRMVKRRGYRIELGEIEAALNRHPALSDAAVIASTDHSGGTRIAAYLVSDDEKRPGIIALKSYSVEALPRYMTPDTFRYLDALPRTSTDKTDYQALLDLSREQAPHPR